MTPEPRLPWKSCQPRPRANYLPPCHSFCSKQSFLPASFLVFKCTMRVFFFLFPKANNVSVSSRASDKRDRVRNHGKPSVKHQEASWQKPWSYAAHYQGDPWRFLQAVQWKTGKSTAQWLLHLGAWLKAPKATISFFIQPVSFISLKCPWKSIIIYFLIYKNRDESKVQNSTTECGACVCVCE